ncbi:MAG TPA: RNB domain-containing ribonuclease [Burkholderiales bacterium]|nr:RNB domain-containing ribonuclease [Burkholderiales bacterium]
MNVLYEEEGAFRVGSIMADNLSSLQVEAPHGKRSKVKAAAVLLRFNDASLGDFLARADKMAADLDPDFLWEVSSGVEELGFEELARDYFGHAPAPAEAAAVLLRLHQAPMYFYKRGKGRYKPAPPDALKAALASAERKRAQAALQAGFVEQLQQFRLPPEFAPRLPLLLYRPDRSSVEWKALEEVCATTRLSPAHLMERCGALPSSHDYHFNRFLLEHFPDGTGFGEFGPLAAPENLPESGVAAFSIDDATTTEIDDAFSVATLPNGNLRVGIHIAAPALGLPPGSPLDLVAARRLSTVYMPGNKITMLPEEAVHLFTLGEERVCPALSMYLEFTPGEFAAVASESRVERLRIAANLRHDTLEEHFNEYTLEAESLDHPFGAELRVLWDLANRLEERRGKAGEGLPPVDYSFRVENDRVTITERRRGSPIDKVVSELMILVNSEWGRALAEAGIAAIYRSQGNGKVKMSTVPAPHQGLGVAQYAWASSPLRRYVDLVNQRQLVAMIRGEDPPYGAKSDALYTAMRDFELAYEAYNEFQRHMERYWSLRWLLQDGKSTIAGVVLRENLVKLEGVPLVHRVPSLPELVQPGDRVEIDVSDVDLLDLSFSARFAQRLEA